MSCNYCSRHSPPFILVIAYRANPSLSQCVGGIAGHCLSWARAFPPRFDTVHDVNLLVPPPAPSPRCIPSAILLAHKKCCSPFLRQRAFVRSIDRPARVLGLAFGPILFLPYSIRSLVLAHAIDPAFDSVRNVFLYIMIATSRTATDSCLFTGENCTELTSAPDHHTLHTQARAIHWVDCRKTVPHVGPARSGVCQKGRLPPDR
jgi:hypothetical protein